MKVFLPAAVLALLSSVQAVSAAVVLTTSAAGYGGPVLDLTGFEGPFTFFNDPLVLADGVTVTPVGTRGAGRLGDRHRSLRVSSNGFAQTTPLLGSNWEVGYLELTFASLVSAFDGFFNYAPDEGDAPVIAAFDSSGGLLGSFDLSVLAPISTPGERNAFAFRGIQSDAADIASIRFGGSFLAYAPSIATVPVPAALPLMLMALGGLAAFGRRRRGTAMG